MARQLGSALGVAIFVAVVSGSPAGGLAGLDGAWLVVFIAAVITAAAGLAASQRRARVTEPATASIAAPARAQPPATAGQTARA
jgi:hypothetical protein